MNETHSEVLNLPEVFGLFSVKPNKIILRTILACLRLDIRFMNVQFPE